MACYHVNNELNEVWFLDNGCPNHLSGVRSIFQNFDESQKMQVSLEDDKQVQLEGKCTITEKNKPC